MLDFLSDTQILNSPETARILIVERNQELSDWLALFLAKSGYEVQQAESIWAAFELLIDYNFDIMIGDANIPGTSNLELIRYCKKRHPAMEVIVISQKPEISEAVILIKEGAFDYLPLPVSRQGLLGKIKEAISEQKDKLIRALTGYDVSLDEHMMNPLPSCDIIKRLGSGSSGVVFLVKRHNEKYALKILRRDLSPKVAGLMEGENFLREAEILSKISHPNVVKIFEYGISGNGVPYILMEYVSGRPLTEFIKKNTLGYQEKINLLVEVCKALSFIHKHGVLHRDIKPGNIIISRDRAVKLADFGIARVSDAELDNPNEIMGSPAYMSPESFSQQDEQDQRSDIFSLGVLAYEMFVGKKPFKGDNVRKLIHSIKNDRPVEPRKLLPNMSENVQYIIGQMIHKKKEDRFQNVDDIITSFEDVLAPAPTSTTRRSKSLISMFMGGSPRAWS